MASAWLPQPCRSRRPPSTQDGGFFLRAGRRRFAFPRRLPPIRVPLSLPHGISLTSVTLEPRAVRVEAIVPEWSEPLVVSDVQQFARLLAPDLDPVVVPLRSRRAR